RIAKDRAIRTKQEGRLRADLDRLAKRVAEKKLVKAEKVNQAIGRLKERYPRVARYFDLSYDAQTATLQAQFNADKYAKAERLDGCYLIKTDRNDLSGDELWRIYILLTRADIDQSWRLSRLKDGRNRVGTGRRQAAPGKRRRSSGFEVGYGGGVDRDELRVHAADLDRAAATKTQPRAVASCGLGRALKRDVIAEALKPALQVCDGAGLTDLVEIGFSEVAVRQSFGEHVIGADENLVGNGEGRAHGAAAGLETVEFVFEVAALG